MPLYEYECDACGHRFEVIVKFSDAPLETCPTCGGPVHKLMSSPAIQFKGSGFYITDYAKKDVTKDTNDGASDTKDAKGAADSAKETKSDTADTKDTKAATDTKDTKTSTKVVEPKAT